MKTKTTIKDVAQKAGLTVGTVSRVINNRGYISKETREKVYNVMRKLNYQPNEIARSLSKQVSNTIGIIMPYINHPYFSLLLDELISVATQGSYKVLLCKSNSQTELESGYIEMLLANRVAGIILCSPSVDTIKLNELRIPVITIERNNDSATAGIVCDNYQGGVLAAEHLISCGCKTLLHFGGVIGKSMPADRRAEGFAEVCENKNIPYRIVPSRQEDGYAMDHSKFVEDILMQNPSVDGVFASNDILAANTVQYCVKNHISIPGQMKIIGFDDTPLAALCAPKLTTIQQPVKGIAQLAVRLIQKNRFENSNSALYVLPVQLIVRETTGRKGK